MRLPTPTLDDRSFQDIVDAAKKLIPIYCPEWTDHNVSDPGVALIELFAWMTEMLLYRVNQVPDKMYMQFLELIGVDLNTTRAAQAEVTFYLSAAPADPLVISAGTEVATVRTETNPAIVFSTNREAVVAVPKIEGLYTVNSSALNDPDKQAWTTHNVNRLRQLGEAISIFPDGQGTRPSTEDSFAILLGQDLSDHVLAVIVDTDGAGGAGIDPDDPPVAWQVSSDVPSWKDCIVEFDSTRGFNSPGENIIVLRVPPGMAARELAGLPGVSGYWLRCVIKPRRGTGAEARYTSSPRVRKVEVESRGLTVACQNALVVKNEFLGRSDGTPSQTFRLTNTPILDLDPTTDYLTISPIEGPVEKWNMKDDFANSDFTNKDYTLDKLTGLITLGPILPQPDGKVYRFGAVPPKDYEVRFTRYRFGGGLAGNVAPGTLTVLKEDLPYVTRVTNWKAGEGGLAAQTLEDAVLRAPQFLRTRTRAVTKDDHEEIAFKVAGVARAFCLAAGVQPPLPDDPKPGHVIVYILPKTTVVPGEMIAPERMIPAQDLIEEVSDRLSAVRLIGTSSEVRATLYIQVGISASVRVSPRTDDATIAELRALGEAAMYDFLNAYVGGPDGVGWPFGRPLYAAEVLSRLQQLPFLSSGGFVERINMRPINVVTGVDVSNTRILIPRHAVICSDRHTINVRRME